VVGVAEAGLPWPKENQEGLRCLNRQGTDRKGSTWGQEKDESALGAPGSSSEDREKGWDRLKGGHGR
jgi:hypothetical protein